MLWLLKINGGHFTLFKSKFELQLELIAKNMAKAARRQLGRRHLLFGEYLRRWTKAVSKTKTQARSTQISKMKHQNLENEAPKSGKRSTQNSKTKHPKLETCLPFKNTRQSLVKSPMLIQQESSTITNRIQFKTIQVELQGVANGFPLP